MWTWNRCYTFMISWIYIYLNNQISYKVNQYSMKVYMCFHTFLLFLWLHTKVKVCLFLFFILLICFLVVFFSLLKLCMTYCKNKTWIVVLGISLHIEIVFKSAENYLLMKNKKFPNHVCSRKSTFKIRT